MLKLPNYKEKLDNQKAQKEESKGRGRIVAVKSPFVRALSLFQKGKNLIEVAIALDLSSGEVQNYHAQYVRLNNQARFYDLYQAKPANYISSLIKIHDRIELEKIDVQNAVAQLRYVELLSGASARYSNLQNENNMLQQENQQIQARQLQLEAKEKQLQAKVEEMEKKNIALQQNYTKLQNQCQEKELAIHELTKEESLIQSRIRNAQNTLADLTSKNGELNIETKQVAGKEACAIAEQNHIGIAPSTSAFISARDAFESLDDYKKRHPPQMIEDTIAFIKIEMMILNTLTS